MLILGDNFDTLDDGAAVLHPIRRYLERAGPQGRSVRGRGDLSRGRIARLMRVIEQINHCLPDDWRLTRSQNNFRVHVQDADEVYVLAGRSFRVTGERVFQVVDTVLRPNFMDKVDRERIAAKEDLAYLDPVAREEEYHRMRREHPEIMRPNLYYFNPPPEDASGPLFARQYERLFQGEEFREFHRIHALTKAGVDAARFRWVEWSLAGKASFTRYPPGNARGKDYWLVPRLDRTAEIGLHERHRSLLAEYGVTVGPDERPPGPYAVEHKLLGTGGFRARDALFARAKEAMRTAGFTIECEAHDSISDRYYDDEAFYLWEERTSLRLREARDAATLTLKAPPPREGADPARYVRLEEEATLTRGQWQAAVAGRLPELPPLDALRRLRPACGELAVRVLVRTTRSTVIIRNADGQHAEVHFDFSRFQDAGGRDIGSDTEIEIESKGMAPVKVAALADLMESALDLSSSSRSKYERGVDFLTLPVV